MTARCCYCHRAGASFRVNAEAVAHQNCAYAADDADEALTLSMMGARPFAPEELVSGRDLSDRQRKVRDLRGRRFGRLLVLAPTTVPHPDGIARAAWLVRCECGREVAMRPYVLLQRGASQCLPCALAAGNARKKLTREQVKEMRILRARGATLRFLAQRAGVSKDTARLAVLGRTWRSAA